MSRPFVIRDLGELEYVKAWHAMRDFTDTRGPGTADEVWLLQHPRVFTQGQAGKAEHVLAPGDIPVIQVDRGGQVTYHGPGQLVAYILVDIRRAGLGIRDLVTHIEQSIVATLALYGVNAAPRPDAPGVYVDGAKIASLGLRVRKGSTFHGLSLNLDMDLEPFGRINPCGHAGMMVTRLSDLLENWQAEEKSVVAERLLAALVARLGGHISRRDTLLPALSEIKQA